MNLQRSAELHDLYAEQFPSGQKVENYIDDKQMTNEHVMRYIYRFNHKKMSITNCNQETSISTSMKGWAKFR